jgi:uncharacterized protein YaiI (UPF0178 family)
MAQKANLSELKTRTQDVLLAQLLLNLGWSRLNDAIKEFQNTLIYNMFKKRGLTMEKLKKIFNKALCETHFCCKVLKPFRFFVFNHRLGNYVLF